MSMARFLQSSARVSARRGPLVRDYEPKEASSDSPTHSSATANRNFCDHSFFMRVITSDYCDVREHSCRCLARLNLQWVTRSETRVWDEGVR
jgi:hypothetical protein